MIGSIKWYCRSEYHCSFQASSCSKDEYLSQPGSVWPACTDHQTPFVLRSVSTKCCLVYCLHNCCFSVWVRFSLPLAVFGFDSPWKRPGRFSAFADSRFPPPMMDSPLASFPLPQKSVIWLRSYFPLALSQNHSNSQTAWAPEWKEVRYPGKWCSQSYVRQMKFWENIRIHTSVTAVTNH